MELTFDYEGCSVTVELESKGFSVTMVETDDDRGDVIELDPEAFQQDHGSDLEEAVSRAAKLYGSKQNDEYMAYRSELNDIYRRL